MAKAQITQIPFPGNSGDTPTGAMQFEHDWPGLFVRGDEAMALLSDLRYAEKLLKQNCGSGLPSQLAKIAEIIARDVILR